MKCIKIIVTFFIIFTHQAYIDAMNYQKSPALNYNKLAQELPQEHQLPNIIDQRKMTLLITNGSESDKSNSKEIKSKSATKTDRTDRPADQKKITPITVEKQNNSTIISDQQIRDIINQLSFKQQINLQNNLQSLIAQYPDDQPIVIKYNGKKYEAEIYSIAHMIRIIQETASNLMQDSTNAPKQLMIENTVEKTASLNLQKISPTSPQNKPRKTAYAEQGLEHFPLDQPASPQLPAAPKDPVKKFAVKDPEFFPAPELPIDYSNQVDNPLPHHNKKDPQDQVIIEEPQNSTEFTPPVGPQTEIETMIKPQQNKDISFKVAIIEPQKHLEQESLLSKKISEKLEDLFNSTLLHLIKKKFRLSPGATIIEFNLADTVVEAIKILLFKLSGISEHLNDHAAQNSPLQNFMNHMKLLEQEIGDYNNSAFYKNPEKMLLLIQAMCQFLKENIIISFSSDMLKIVDSMNSLATTCCNLCRSENMVFSTANAPADVLAQFQPNIDATDNLSSKEYSHDLIWAIYNKQGLVDNIIQNWGDFKKSQLYKSPVNRQYAAFITLLLLFENTIVATAMLINEINLEHSLISNQPIIINIDQ